MEFRSFYGSTIREALDAARRELGPDAAILASRKAETAPGEPVTFEAVCGVVSGSDGAKSAPARTDARKVQAAPGTPIARRIPASESKTSVDCARKYCRTPAAPVSNRLPARPATLQSTDAPGPTNAPNGLVKHKPWAGEPPEPCRQHPSGHCARLQKGQLSD